MTMNKEKIKKKNSGEHSRCWNNTDVFVGIVLCNVICVVQRQQL